MESANAGRVPLRGGRRTRTDAVLATMRPRQWVKNALVVAAAGAAGALGHDDTPGRVTVAFAAFCLLASGIYAINDVSDAQEDRRHPRKRFRPVAAGELDPRFATGLGLSLLLAGLLLCAAIGPLLALVGFAYASLSLSYTLVWRHLIVFDIFAVAGGFVLRAVAGGVAAPVSLSRWFLLVVSSSAVFVAAAKRYAELRRADGSDAGRRRVLDAYSPRALELIIAGATAVALLAYCMWAFSLPSVRGIPWRPLTVVPFATCLLRYGDLVHRGAGEAPEDVLLSDRPLQLAALVWLVLFAFEVHAAG
ncbi:MAG TPA: decaprenyl-phosphate phosphoribosyltransferase [Solirubrobacteraceae bacterium]|nr:decaprenyl-phosphate phosphoribosyltransferase [Solirubrobacteraceae bacterium]